MDSKKYICPRCRYKFRIKENSTARKRCPNCANENIMEDNFDLNRLIDNS